jgi:hypothetical protein
MTIRLQVTLKSVYGTTKVYPANAAANHLCDIAKTQTLTSAALRSAIAMGCEVEVLGRANAVYSVAVPFPAQLAQ